MTRIQTINLEGKIYSLGYKVVTSDMKSLGLRKNPNIMTYSSGEWMFLPEDMITEGKQDFGGIWVAKTISGAKSLRKYMRNEYDIEARIFVSALDRILYHNSYRMKTNGIYLISEMAG